MDHYVGEPKSHDHHNVFYEHIKVMRLVQLTMHESWFSKDVFRGKLSSRKQWKGRYKKYAEEK